MLGREPLHALGDRLAVREHDVAAGQDVLVVPLDAVVQRGVLVVPGAVVVDDVGDDDVGVERVDDPGKVGVGRVHPEDRRPVADAAPLEDRLHVVGVPLAPGRPSRRVSRPPCRNVR